MAIKITKFSKTDLLFVSETDVILTDTSGMTISHFADSVKSTEATIPFEIEGVNDHIPQIEDTDFCTVVRKQVNLTATGVNENARKNVGEDIGEFGHKDNVPPRTLDLPPGFRELFRND